MALNFPGPYELRLEYAVNGLSHEMRHSIVLDSPVNKGEDFTNITGTTPDGSTITLSQYCVDWTGVLAPLYGAGNTSFVSIELWIYAQNSFNADFVSVYTPTVVPSGSGGGVLAQQSTYTWRTLEGGIFKQVLLEARNSGNEVRTFQDAGNAEQAFFNFFVDPTKTLAVGRDTSRPFAPLRVSRGQNEAVWRKRYR